MTRGKGCGGKGAQGDQPRRKWGCRASRDEMNGPPRHGAGTVRCRAPVRQIDGPMVLEWNDDAIDDKYFADVVRAEVVSLMSEQAGAAETASATRLVLGRSIYRP